MQIISKMTQDARTSGRRLSFVYYADNVFIYDVLTKTLYSFDGVKMESGARLWEGHAVGKHIATNTFANEDKSLIAAMAFFCAEMSINTQTMLFQRVITNPGLSTGVRSTFINNHYRTCNNTIKLLDEVDADWLASTKEDDVLPLVESTTSYGKTCDSNDTSLNRKPLPYCLDITNLKDFKEFGPVVRLDLLGNDATAVLDYDDDDSTSNPRAYLIGCLDKERLLKALLFKKTVARTQDSSDVEPDDEEHKTLANAVVQYGKIYTLYLVGGFAYKDTHLMMNSMFNSAKEDIKQFSMSLTPEELLQVVDKAINTLMSLEEMTQVEKTEGLRVMFFTMIEEVLKGKSRELTRAEACFVMCGNKFIQRHVLDFEVQFDRVLATMERKVDNQMSRDEAGLVLSYSQAKIARDLDKLKTDHTVNVKVADEKVKVKPLRKSATKRDRDEVSEEIHDEDAHVDKAVTLDSDDMDDDFLIGGETALNVAMEFDDVLS